MARSLRITTTLMGISRASFGSDVRWGESNGSAIEAAAAWTIVSLRVTTTGVKVYGYSNESLSSFIHFPLPVGLRCVGFYSLQRQRDQRLLSVAVRDGRGVR